MTCTDEVLGKDRTVMNGNRTTTTRIMTAAATALLTAGTLTVTAPSAVADAALLA